MMGRGPVTTLNTGSTPGALRRSGSKVISEDFPGGLVVKTPSFLCKGCRFDPWLLEN